MPFGRATSHTPCSSASSAKEKAFAFSSATVHPRTFSPPVTAPSAASTRKRPLTPMSPGATASATCAARGSATAPDTATAS